MQKINILIPANGLGTRFREEGYHYPKPLINVLGKPMIFWLLDNLNLEMVEIISIPYTNILDAYAFQRQVQDRYKHAKFKFLPISSSTRGAAETVLIGLENLDVSDLDRPILLLDCDTFYFEDVVRAFVNAENQNHIFYFEDTQSQPIFSYIELDNNIVSNIAEKVKISNNANCGLYGFSSGTLLKSLCKELVSESDSTKELYISSIYKRMLGSYTLTASRVDNFNCVGTPLQLRVFCENYNTVVPKRFCFDLDHTLVTSPQVPGDYTTCKPIVKNIDYLRYLKSQGHEIIVYTARRMRTHKYNLGAVVKDIGLITLEQLRDLDIPYDEIYFGKPLADFYIDDLAVNCNQSLDKQTGFYNSTIKSRYFNSVEILNRMVVKTGAIAGERFYYKQLQQYPQLQQYFPSILEDSVDKIIIEKIAGINFSYLYTNNCLTAQHLSALLSALRELHSTPVNTITSEQVAEYAVAKLEQRYQEYDYSQYHDYKDTYNRIKQFLKNHYKCLPAPVMIHGDPVFTNVITNSKQEIKLIDMRGKIGNQYTVGGDWIYDLAKVYQSLIGYDFVLNNQPVAPNYQLINQFEIWLQEHYKINLATVAKYTASLYFTLIPLHHDEKCQQYYQLARTLIK